MQLFVLFGTPVYLSGSYLLLLLFFCFGSLSSSNFQEAFLIAFAVTASLIVHEFGHVWAAKKNGHSSQVVLMGIGAMTIPSGESHGWQGVRLSLAGPIAGFILALVAFYGFAPANELPLWDYVLGARPAADGTNWPFLQLLLVRIGILWGIFNLLPILPMDGGHALRDFLSTFMRRNKADGIAARVSIAVAIPVIFFIFQAGFMIGAILIGWMTWQNYESLRRN